MWVCMWVFSKTYPKTSQLIQYVTRQLQWTPSPPPSREKPRTSGAFFVSAPTKQPAQYLHNSEPCAWIKPIGQLDGTAFRPPYPAHPHWLPGYRILENGVGVVMAYETIDGQKYEKELLDLARKHTTGRGEGKLSKDEVADLFKSAQDGPGVTDTEKATLAYIRKNFEFTDAAAKDFDAAFGKL